MLRALFPIAAFGTIMSLKPCHIIVVSVMMARLKDVGGMDQEEKGNKKEEVERRDVEIQ